MKDIYSSYITDDAWLIKNTEWARPMQSIRESQFALGNGYIGIRGVLEDIPYDALPGTYIAGVYDKMGSQVDELVNLPNPVNFKFTVEGQKLDVIAADVLSHMRALNMKKGLLVRHDIYRDAHKKCYDYQSLRFISMHQKNTGVIRIALTSLDQDCVVDVNTGIDTSIANAGVLSEGQKRHFRVCELGQQDNAGYLVIETFDKKNIITYWSGFHYQINGKEIYAQDNVFQLKLKKNQTVIFTKIFTIKDYPYKQGHADYKKKSLAIFKGALNKGFLTLLDEHISAWDKKWKRSDVVIKGTANLQQNLRFNIYHMLTCGISNNGLSSIGARALSSEGYRGHIFWDTEIFLFPFYLFNYPDIAKSLLFYRYKRLNKAKELALAAGYKGAKFPWESASTGDEETPGWAKDIDSKVTRVHTHEYEHHVTADIAYAVYKYFVVTEDNSFMEKYGYEMLAETARFWASRVKFNKRTKKYDILNVIGPDEIHIDVKNNAFTNMMAKWNLITASKLLFKLRGERAGLYKKLRQQLNLKTSEIQEWKNIASRISFLVNKKGIIEQFEGYFKLKNVTLTETDENGIPEIPVRPSTKNLALTQLVKQADVVMLLYLLGDVFSDKTKKDNYNYYIERTLHRSSLSPSVHSAVACECNDMQRAYNLFNLSLRADISNIHNNTHEGIHAASLGGTWQAMLFGFCGLKVAKEKLSINPKIPRTWREVAFSLYWKRSLLDFKITNSSVRVKMHSRVKKEQELIIYGRRYHIKPGRWQDIQQPSRRNKERYCYS